MTLPHFLGLGALKAGTTTLHTWLEEHPGVATAEGRKEVMFFDRHWDRGLPWYEAHFAHAGARVPGEVSPNYLFDPEVPARVAAVLPDAVTFAVLRDPVARARSQHQFFRQERGYTGDLRTFLAEHPNAVARGRYAEQLTRWFDHTPRERLAVFLLEEVSVDPATAARALFRHVGVDPTFVPPSLGRRTNESGTPRFPRVRTLGRRVARWLYDHDLGPVVQRVKGTRVYDAVLGARAKRAHADDATPADVQAQLHEAYADDLATLSRLLGRPLDVWPTARATQ